jgi:hypothetical protein
MVGNDIQESLTTKLGLVSKDVAVWANTVAMNHYNHTRSSNYVLELIEFLFVKSALVVSQKVTKPAAKALRILEIAL